MFFIAGVPTPGQSVMNPSVHFEQPALDAVTLEEILEHDHLEFLCAWKMEKVTVIVVEV